MDGSENITNATIYDCQIDDYSSEEELFAFIAYGIFLNLIGFMGIIGNVITMIILSRPQMRSSINYLLIGLARCDTVLIVTSIFIFGVPAIYRYTKTDLLYFYQYKIYPYLCLIAFPVALIAQTVSVYLTLTVTVERFVAVCLPLQARSLCTYGRARLYLIIIVIFSTLYNMTRFWEIKVEEVVDYQSNSTVLIPCPSDLRRNRIYISVYIHWLYMVFIYFLPFSFLAVLNGAIYRQVRRANHERQRLSRLQKKEIGLATMLLCVVVVFVLCNILPLVNNVLENSYNITIDQLVKINNLLVTLNSSVNFIIYVIFGEKFKRLLLKMLCSHGMGPCACVSALGGKDLPDGATPVDSMISSGDERNYSVRSAIPCQIHRSGSTIERNGWPSRHKDQRSMRVSRTPYSDTCVYYLARTDNCDETATLNQV